MKTHTIAVLGSTGSIGRQALDVAERLGLRVAALTANTSTDLLEEQARKFHPDLVALMDPAAALMLRLRLAGTGIRVEGGMEGVLEAAALPEADAIVHAIVGVAGLLPALTVLKAGKRLALANKETLVCAGELVLQTAEQYGGEIVPVDSEHSAIFQCLQGCADRKEVRRLILTCSGGPFYGKSFADLAGMKKADALQHPNWHMGPKITVDSATLMNKGLEVIEAMRLYRLPLEQVSVVIHRQSIVHSLVEFQDGAVLAQLGTPDMRLPIQYALTWPERMESSLPALDLLTCPPLTFAEPDREAFPCLRLAEEAAREGGTATAILNGANEAAVALFLQEKIGFNDIPRLVEKALETVPVQQALALEDIREADRRSRSIVEETAKHRRPGSV